MNEEYSDLSPSSNISRLLEIMQRLRDPETGCPWDQKQTFKSITPYTIEEAYEVRDAIERENMDDLCDELGDLLLQVVYHAEIAKEKGAFDFGDIVKAITAKMLRRHPHVFGNDDQKNNGFQKGQWEAIKQQEKNIKQKGSAFEGQTTFLSIVPIALPALTHALKLQKKTSKVGFDWDNLDKVFEKMKEEIQEFEEEYSKINEYSFDKDALEKEMGDILFVAVNLSRHLKIDPEAALHCTNQKFIKRFNFIEESLNAQGLSLEKATLEEMEAEWQNAKKLD